MGYFLWDNKGLVKNVLAVATQTANDENTKLGSTGILWMCSSKIIVKLFLMEGRQEKETQLPSPITVLSGCIMKCEA